MHEKATLCGKKIILTGGGTAGHVLPNITLMPKLRELGFDIYYVGSYDGIERGLVEFHNIPYYGISSGKLRRYFDFKNFTDVFRIIKGVWDSLKILSRIKPDIIFSKGGFVVVPLIFAAKIKSVKVIIHESDLTPGLANRLAQPLAKKVLVSFPETLKYVPKKKSILTGIPVRSDLTTASKEEGLRFLNFRDSGKPIMLVMGGSQGSAAINAYIRKVLPELLKRYRVVLLCGRGNLCKINLDGYREYEVLNKDLPRVLMAADIIVSRAGANTLFELLVLRKPNLLIPLTLGQSRGDQIINAESFRNRGFSAILDEKFLAEKFFDEVHDLYINREKYVRAMSKVELSDAAKEIIEVIIETL